MYISNLHMTYTIAILGIATIEENQAERVKKRTTFSEEGCGSRILKEGGVEGLSCEFCRVRAFQADWRPSANRQGQEQLCLCPGIRNAEKGTVARLAAWDRAQLEVKWEKDLAGASLHLRKILQFHSSDWHILSSRPGKWKQSQVSPSIPAWLWGLNPPALVSWDWDYSKTFCNKWLTVRLSLPWTKDSSALCCPIYPSYSFNYGTILFMALWDHPFPTICQLQGTRESK